MFTGIIQEVGTVASMAGGHLVVTAAMASGDLADIKLGDSIAIGGPCLTVVEHAPRRLTFDVSPETLRRSSLGAWRAGQRVNLERALRLGDRLDGHLVQGHVDGVGRLVARTRAADGYELSIELEADLLPYVVAKGSVALDGVSLTIAWLEGARIGVAVVPHTAAKTTLGDLPVGATLNVETDILGRYVARLLAFGRGDASAVPGAGAGGAAKPGGLTLDALARGGFLDL